MTRFAGPARATRRTIRATTRAAPTVGRWEATMHRRAFLKSAAALATSGLATPAISQRAAARTLRFVPQADLASFDPIWNTQYVVRNGAALIWDMLYGVDENLQPRRQMRSEEHTSELQSPDHLVCRLLLEKKKEHNTIRHPACGVGACPACGSA